MLTFLILRNCSHAELLVSVFGESAVISARDRLVSRILWCHRRLSVRDLTIQGSIIGTCSVSLSLGFNGALKFIGSWYPD